DITNLAYASGPADYSFQWLINSGSLTYTPKLPQAVRLSGRFPVPPDTTAVPARSYQIATAFRGLVYGPNSNIVIHSYDNTPNLPNGIAATVLVNSIIGNAVTLDSTKYKIAVQKQDIESNNPNSYVLFYHINGDGGPAQALNNADISDLARKPMHT